LKKRTKKLSLLGALARAVPNPAGIKVFLLLFFQKKKRLIALPFHRSCHPLEKVVTSLCADPAGAPDS
jgi:hypothetical protein